MSDQLPPPVSANPSGVPCAWWEAEPAELSEVARRRRDEIMDAAEAIIAGQGIDRLSLSQIDVPTALIWGRHDRATPLAIAEAASRQFGWRLEVIDGAADDPTLEQPEAFLGALRRAIATFRQE